jgi:hypothetical protein
MSTSLTIASWNMSPKTNDVGKWQHLRKLGVDIALVQEGRPLPQPLHFHTKRGAHKPTAHDRGIAFAMLSDMKPMDFVASLAGGDVLVASVPDFGNLLMVNVHSLRGVDAAGKNESDSSAMLARCIPAIKNLLNDDRPTLIAGDFNASIDLNYQFGPMRRVFSTLRELGLSDVLCNSDCDIDASGQCLSPHPRTLHRGEKSWRIDHMYVNAKLRQRLTSGSIDTSDAALLLSDHRPLLATFAL